jgi:Chalcone isomerase-like
MIHTILSTILSSSSSIISGGRLVDANTQVVETAPTTTVNSAEKNDECDAAVAVTTSIMTTTAEEVIEGISLPSHRILDGIPLYKNGHGVRSINFFGMDIKIYVASMYSSTPIHTEKQVFSLRRHHNYNNHNNHHNPLHYPFHHHDSTNFHHNNTTTTTSLTATSPSTTQHRLHPTPNNPENHKQGHTDYTTQQQQQQQQHPNKPVVLQLDFTFLRYVNRNRVINAWTQQLDHSVSFRYDGYESDRDAFIKAASSQPIQHGGTQSVLLVGDETQIIDQGTHTASIHGHNFQQSFLSMWFGERAVASDLKEGLLQGHSHHHNQAARAP